MSRVSGILVASILAAVLSGADVSAAESRVPTAQQFKEMIRQYNESGNAAGLQRMPQTPKTIEQFNRALALHTRKDATARDLREAAALYQAAADGGIPQASTNLALLYLEGKGIKKDVKKALSLLHAAGSRGDSQADVALARLYLNGTDVKRDEKKAELLLNKAVKAGNPNAVRMLSEYRDWKKKNEISMKQYQELLKQMQAQNKTVAAPLPQGGPRLPQQIDAGFPVIPGYPYLPGHQAPMPSFIDESPQPQVFEIIPDGNPGFQPVKVEAAR